MATLEKIKSPEEQAAARQRRSDAAKKNNRKERSFYSVDSRSRPKPGSGAPIQPMDTRGQRGLPDCYGVGYIFPPSPFASNGPRRNGSRPHAGFESQPDFASPWRATNYNSHRDREKRAEKATVWFDAPIVDRSAEELGIEVEEDD